MGGRVNYSYYRDEKGGWGWRMLAADGSVLQDSGAGYGNERACLEAIARISGSSNGCSVTREKLNGDESTPTANCTTIGENLTETMAAVETVTIETTTSLQIPPDVEVLRTGPPGSNTNTIDAENIDPASGIATEKKSEAPKDKAEPAINGKVSKSGVVDCMLGESSVASVFTTKDNQLRWKYRANGGNVPASLRPAIAHFDTIMSTIKVSVAKPYQRECYHRLGKALFGALHGPEGTEVANQFRAVRLLVRTKAKERARLVYVVASLAATMLLSLFILPLYKYVTNPEIRLITLGGCFGSIGACISVLQRNPSLDIDPWMSNGYLKLQGITRVVLGFIFGCIFALASKANFVLGVVRDNPYPLLVLCIVAGFSERVIPELLSKFESSNAVRAKGKEDSSEE